MHLFSKQTPRIVFVNGICTSLENAKRDALSLSSSSELIWNATAWEGIYQNDESTSAKEAIQQLKALISHQLKLKQPICIVAHSKGCHITWKAIDALFADHQKAIQEFVYLYMFGGVALIPNHFGRVVENWKSYGSFKLQDGVADLGGEWLRLKGREPIHTWTSIRRYPDLHSHYTLKTAENKYSAVWSHHNFRKSYLEIAKNKVSHFEQKHRLRQNTLWQQCFQLTKRMLPA